MKAIKVFALMLMATLISTSFTSCGEEDVTVDDAVNLINGSFINRNIQRTDNQIIYTANAKLFFTYTATATFEDGKCTSLIATLECKSTLIADGCSKAYDLLVSQGKVPPYKREGNTLMFDYTMLVQGLDKTKVEERLNSILTQLETIASQIIQSK